MKAIYAILTATKNVPKDMALQHISAGGPVSWLPESPCILALIGFCSLDPTGGVHQLIGKAA
jgi:hypothetical protein